MKKIISSIAIASLVLCSCSKEKEPVAPVTTQEISSYVGIGKVIPKDGMIQLSVDKTQKVTKIYKSLGDTIQQGDVLFDMAAVTEQLQVEQANAAYQSVKARNESLVYEIKQAQIKLADLKNQWQVSRRLYAQKAETKQKVITDSLAYLQQQQVIKQLKQQQIADAKALQEQNVQVKASTIDLQGQKFRAMQSGILTQFDIKVGEILQPNTVFGELASASEWIIDGEIDEFYANEIKENQKVEISLVGQTQVIAKGNISFVGLGLQNKSILYETVGEANDRRVRRFNVQITEGADRLLINQKVECKILK